MLLGPLNARSCLSNMSYSNGCLECVIHVLFVYTSLLWHIGLGPSAAQGTTAHSTPVSITKITSDTSPELHITDNHKKHIHSTAWHHINHITNLICFRPCTLRSTHKPSRCDSVRVSLPGKRSDSNPSSCFDQCNSSYQQIRTRCAYLNSSLTRHRDRYKCTCFHPVWGNYDQAHHSSTLQLQGRITHPGTQISTDSATIQLPFAAVKLFTAASCLSYVMKLVLKNMRPQRTAIFEKGQRKEVKCDAVTILGPTMMKLLSTRFHSGINVRTDWLRSVDGCT